MKIDTIVCGDCLDVMAEMPENSIDLIVTSPPYNVGKDYNGFSDEMPWFRWYDLIHAVIFSSWAILRPGGTLALNVLKEARWQKDHKYSENLL